MANLRGFGGFAAPFPTSETVGTSVADPALGSEWTNAAGDKKYIVVDCQQAFVAGEFVFIDQAHLATRMTDTLVNARVGVIVAAVSASDTKAYAQIYGLYEGAAASSNVASTLPIGPATGSSDIGAVTYAPSSNEGTAVIQGAWAVTSPDSALTSGPASSFVNAAGTSTIYIGASFWLNYPYVMAHLSGQVLDT
jgi:hypothetical protein